MKQSVTYICTYIHTYIRTYPLLKFEERTVETKQSRCVHEQEFISLLIICMYSTFKLFQSKDDCPDKVKNKES